LVDVNALPASSTATQSVVDRQVTAENPVSTKLGVTSTQTAFQIPLVGDVVVQTSPLSSTATHNETDGHETARTESRGWKSKRCHVGATASGFVETNELPYPSTATHSDGEGHETASGVPEVLTRYQSGPANSAHAFAPPVGFVERKASPPVPLSSTRQRVSDAQATALNAESGWTAAEIHVAEPPVGLDVLTTLPCWSAARHSDVEEQDRTFAPKCASPVEADSVHAPAPPVGFVEVQTPPSPSSATQSEADGHETLHNPAAPATLTGLQVLAPPAGFVEVRTFPWSSTPTQSEFDGHDIDSRLPVFSTPPNVHAAGPPVGLVDVIMAESSPPNTTQSEADAHVTPVAAPSPWFSTFVHEGALAPGFVDVMTWLGSMATHSEAVGHEIPSKNSSAPSI